MRLLQGIKVKVADWVWNPLADDAGWWRRQLVTAARIAVCVGNDLRSGALSLRAMGLVFTTLLALVPLIAVSFSVLKGFGVHNQVEPALQQLLAPLGERSREITDRIVGAMAIAEKGAPIEMVGSLLYEERMGIALRKGNPELKKALNEALAAIKNDGTYHRISMKWLKTDAR